MTLMFAASSARITVSGGLSTARSNSLPTGRLSTASRTEPPTKRAAMPCVASAANSRRDGWSFIQAGGSMRLAGFMTGSCRKQPAVALALREEHHHEADDGAGEAGDGEPGDGQVLPLRQGAGELALLLDLDRPGPQEKGGRRRQHQDDHQQSNADHRYPAVRMNCRFFSIPAVAPQM